MKRTFAALAMMAAALAAMAASPEPSYRSTTAGYSPYREQAIADWRAANEEMGQLHGHMGHLGGNTTSQPMALPQAAPADADQGGHRPMGDKP